MKFKTLDIQRKIIAILNMAIPYETENRHTLIVKANLKMRWNVTDLVHPIIRQTKKQLCEELVK